MSRAKDAKPAVAGKPPLRPAAKQPTTLVTADARKPAPRKRSTGGKSKPPPPLETPAGIAPDKDGYIVFNGRRVRVISTKNVTKKRVVRESRAAAAAAAEEDRKPLKTKLNKRELDHYRDLLIHLRAQKLGDLSAKENEALNSSGGNLSHMPIHMADIGTDAYDQDFMLGLAQTDRELIRDIDSALQRIEDKTYGMCLMTGKPIPKTRLNAKPWAKHTIEAVRLIENGQAG